jgi:hypothetical protein
MDGQAVADAGGARIRASGNQETTVALARGAAIARIRAQAPAHAPAPGVFPCGAVPLSWPVAQRTARHC